MVSVRDIYVNKSKQVFTYLFTRFTPRPVALAPQLLVLSQYFIISSSLLTLSLALAYQVN